MFNFPNLLELLGKVDEQSIINNVFHYATPKLAAAAFRIAFERGTDEGLQKIGRILRFAADKLTEAEPDRVGAANELGRALGEIKLF